MGKSGSASRSGASAAPKIPTFSRYGKPVGRPPGAKRSSSSAEAGRKQLEDVISRTSRTLTRAQYERQVIEPLAKRLDGNAEWQRLLTRLSSGTVEGIPAHGFATTRDAVRNLIDRWTMGSELPISRAIAQAAMDEFGLSASRSVSRDAVSHAQVERAFQGVEPGLRQFARAVYDQTQAWFAKRGVSSVRLYRGSAEAQTIHAGQSRAMTLTTRPLTSWTTHFGTAAEFGTQHEGRGQVQAVDVPVSRIFSMPLSGLGEMSKREALVLGGSYRGAATSLRFKGDLASWYHDTRHAESEIGAALDGRTTGAATRAIGKR